ncbi:response regulator transcription factor [Amycolatopsis sp.]|uniref:response regulator transcription factor n=1 Tax=Amycolatopsis sp. TaxID=37632 RepID=UPI002D7F4802|nr:response regulator transcription factor [Amycolatopsis sp.]HET6709010.1 response regulator transcription factor [Amycolatopsis sp.]
MTTSCTVCGEPLPGGPETGRPRKFCSDRCRSKAHRDREREAERARERLARRCEIEVAGNRCARGAVFVLAVDGRELKVCPACRELALSFLVGQGAAATAVETRRIATPDRDPAPQPTERGTVLLVEDDDSVAAALGAALRSRGYEVRRTHDGATGLREALERRPDLVLLDLGLPDTDGLVVLRKLRDVSDLPVIITTARGADNDKIRGLDSGADDYLVKPFHIEELLARMRTVLRHRAPRPDGVYDDGVLRVDFALKQVRAAGSDLVLSPREYRLLEFLVRKPGTARPAAAIIAHVGGVAESKRYLAVLVNRVRQKLGAEGLGRGVIVAANGIGYYYRPPGRTIGYSHAANLVN